MRSLLNPSFCALALCLSVIGLTAPLAAAPAEGREVGYLFTSFRGNGDGLHLAVSRDGLKWTDLGRVFLRPTVGSKLMRDPHIVPGPDGLYHMVWTTGWKDKGIGHASTRDFVTWSEQRYLPLMENVPGTQNCWAPETFYDPAGKQYIITWSSDVEGRFPDTRSKDRMNNRTYYVTTPDFQTFSEPRLLIDPGFDHIDTTIIPFQGRYIAVFKEGDAQAKGRWGPIHSAISDHPLGPYTLVPQPLITERAEGPALVNLGDRTLLYVDFYANGRYGVYETTDWRTWKDVTSSAAVVRGQRHGTILAVPLALLGNLSPAFAQPARAADPNGWVNPLIPQRADPHVVLHTDGYYYLTATVPEYDRIELRRARTIGGLASAEAKLIWRKHPRGPMSAHIWAPEIHFIDGKWYIYFAAGKAEAIWDIRMYVLENASANPLEGQWTEKGQLKTEWESFSLDATTFEYRGTRYLCWTQTAPNVRGTNIYLAKMDTPWSIVGPQVLISRPDLPWERIGHWVNEAPAFIHRNGRVFIVYSASATDANYCLGLLTADEDANLLDPKSWTKSPTPVFKSDRTTSQFGPGHNSFTTTPDGKTDLLVYHARNYEKIDGEPLRNPDRATRVQVLKWKPDGTPDFGVPVADGPYAP